MVRCQARREVPKHNCGISGHYAHCNNDALGMIRVITDDGCTRDIRMCGECFDLAKMHKSHMTSLIQGHHHLNIPLLQADDEVDDCLDNVKKKVDDNLRSVFG